MMRVVVRVNTNNGFEDIGIEKGAINEFTRTGFEEGTYDATVSFVCLPAFADPDELLVIFEQVKEFIENTEFWIKTIRALWKFLKKCHRYKKTIWIGEKIVDVDENITEEEFEDKIMLILSKEAKRMGEEVNRILNEKETLD